MVDRARKIVAEVTKKHYTDLNDIRKKSLCSFANYLYEEEMIGKAVMEKPKIRDIIHEFIAFLNFKNTLDDIHEHCQKFLKAAYIVGGSYRATADALGKAWTEAIEKELGPANSSFGHV